MNTFSLVLGLGAALGLGWVAEKSARVQAGRLMDAGLWVLLGALVGGRAVFVTINWVYFQAHIPEIPQVWLGGISGPGALGGGLLVLALVALASHQPLGDLSDALVPLAIAVVVSAWLACWLVGSAYGPTTNAWWGLPARDEWGVVTRRWPLQLLGVLLTLGVSWLIDWSRGVYMIKDWLALPGRVASLWLLGLGIELFGLSYLRVDPGLAWNGLRLETWAAVGLAGVAVLSLMISSFLATTRLKGIRDIV